MGFWGRLIELGFKSYAEYLDGKHWQEFKAKYKSSGKPRRCAVCNDTPIQLHHHTYERLGKELLTDVTPLCHDHHQQVHVILKKNGWFVEKTPQAMAEISGVTMIATPPKRKRSILKKEKPSKKKPKTLPLKKNKFEVEFAKVCELRSAEMVFLFEELVKRGYAHRGVPTNYSPSIGDSVLPKHLVLMIRSWKSGVTRESLNAHDRLTVERNAAKKKRQKEIDGLRRGVPFTFSQTDSPMLQIRKIVAGFRR